jgi:hypothetical protein
MKKISPTQQKCIDRLQKTGGTLKRWPGGYWSDERPTENYLHGDQPDWHVGTPTVTALVAQGVLTAVNPNSAFWRREFRLSEAFAQTLRARSEPETKFQCSAVGGGVNGHQ